MPLKNVNISKKKFKLLTQIHRYSSLPQTHQGNASPGAVGKLDPPPETTTKKNLMLSHWLAVQPKHNPKNISHNVYSQQINRLGPLCPPKGDPNF